MNTAERRAAILQLILTRKVHSHPPPPKRLRRTRARLCLLACMVCILPHMCYS
jgi:hypothetical protein